MNIFSFDLEPAVFLYFLFFYEQCSYPLPMFLVGYSLFTFYLLSSLFSKDINPLNVMYIKNILFKFQRLFFFSFWCPFLAKKLKTFTWSNSSILSSKVSEFYGILSMSLRIANITQLQETKSLNTGAQVNKIFCLIVRSLRIGGCWHWFSHSLISGLMSHSLLAFPFWSQDGLYRTSLSKKMGCHYACPFLLGKQENFPADFHLSFIDQNQVTATIAEREAGKVKNRTVIMTFLLGVGLWPP